MQSNKRPFPSSLTPSAHNELMAFRLVLDPTAVSMTEDVVLEDFAQTAVFFGQEAVVMTLSDFFKRGFEGADIQNSILLADAGAISLNLTISGEQVAPFWGLPCTGRNITLDIVMICRFRKKKLRRIELYYEAATLLHQLGLAL